MWRKFLMGENIDKFDKFLSIRQHFPHQNYPMIIFLPDHFFAQCVIASIHIHMKLSLSKYIYVAKKQWSIATCAFQTDQQSYAITYIASN